jgi:carbamoyl-phosphate synthase large subunit
MPFVSKTWGTNLMELAAHVVVEGKLPPEDKPMSFAIPHVGVKVPQFSFVRLKGADPVLGVEMVSTGEVACLGDNLSDALIKALEAAEVRIPRGDGAVLLTIAGREYKRRIVPLAKRLQRIGMRIYATENTSEILRLTPGMQVEVLHKVSDPENKPNIRDLLLENKIDLVINIPVADESKQESGILQDEYTIRRLAVESNIPVVTSIELAWAILRAIEYRRYTSPEVKALSEFVASEDPKPPQMTPKGGPRTH